jgi:hypothetical protein
MAEREGYENTEPTGMTVRERERREERRRRGEPEPDEANPSGQGTVSERIERSSVIGTTGHGGALDEEISQ